MIVAAHTFLTIDKYFAEAKLTPGLPDDVLQPSRTPRIAAQFQVPVAHHVEQDHRSRTLQLVVRAQLRDVMPAAVSVVGTFLVATLRPAFTKRFFAVEEHESIRCFRFFLATTEHSTNLEQRSDRRC